MFCLRFSFLISTCLLFPHENPVLGWSCLSTPVSRRQVLAKGVAVITTSTVLVSDIPAVAHAEETDNDNDKAGNKDEEQKQQEIRQRLLERRKLMQASRSSNNRQSYLDLSRQRAALYNTTSKAVSCPPNVPCY